jgi:hypothetical protein
MQSSTAPDDDQSEKAIKKWLKSHLKVGLIVAVKRTEDGQPQFERGKVISIRPRNFNVSTEQADGTFPDSGMTFEYSGEALRESAVRLVMPTEAVLAACKSAPTEG